MVSEKELREMSEEEYRSLDIDSYSSIKVFLDSPVKYYRKFILKESFEDEVNDDMKFGTLVDMLKFQPEKFEELYYVRKTAKPDKPQYASFIEHLAKLTVLDLEDSVEERIKKAYETAGYGSREKLDTIKSKFLVDKIGYDHFTELVEQGTRPTIGIEEIEWAKSLIYYLETHRYTKDIMSAISDYSSIEVIDQYKISGNIKGLQLKGMVDRCIIDHNKKIIKPYDLKVTSGVFMFPYNYLKLRYYLQMSIYTEILRQNYPTYKVEPLSFIICDKYRKSDPLIVKPNETDFMKAVSGFMVSGKYYEGLYNAIEQIKYHTNTSIWTSSKEAQENNGVVKLDLER